MAIQPEAEPAGCFHEAAAADDRAITRYLPNGSTTAPGATTVNAATVSLVTLPKPRLPDRVGRVDRIILMLDLHSTSVIDPAPVEHLGACPRNRKGLDGVVGA
jgi:hypothetical protein